MKPSLCISFRFIQPYPLFHGRGDPGESEWPPSPMRAFQALLNAACLRTRGKPLPPEVRSALQVIEVLRPSIIAPRAALSATGHRAYVPHNQADLVAAAWGRGNVDASIASHRIEKDFHPRRIEIFGDDLPTIHYIYLLDATNADPAQLLVAIRPAVRSIHCLGWGIDQVIADATLVESAPNRSNGETWIPTPRGGHRLHTHRGGSLDALIARHDKFLNRLIESDWTPVPPLSAIDQVYYRRDSDPVARPCAVFKLLDDNDDTVAYPQSKLIHIAGMVKHLAIEQMKRNPPRDLRGRGKDEWIDAYVAGHQWRENKEADANHTQFSYIPLQSIGNPNTDPGVRRAMIVAPLGDDAWLERLASQLNGMRLKPLPNTALPEGTHLERIDEKKKDSVRDVYLGRSLVWASVTPIILPGHDDHKPEKTCKLIEKAIAQSGLDQPCEFEWGPFSLFRKILPAFKYRRDSSDPRKKILINYVRPDHLLEQTAVHLQIRFGHRENPTDPNSRWIPVEYPIPGPITLGAGRHCGFGLMAAI